MPVEILKTVRLKGFKSIKELDLQLSPFNVLIGANGSGKSNLISFFQMLSFAFGSNAGNLRGYVKAEGPASQLLFYGPSVSPKMSAELRFVEHSVAEGEQQAWSDYGFELTFGQGTREEGEKLFFSEEHWRFFVPGNKNPNERPLGSPHEESRVLSIASEHRNSIFRSEAIRFRERLRRLKVYHFHNTNRESYIRLSQDLQRSGNYLMRDGGNLWVFLYNLKLHSPAHFKRILSTVQLVAPFIQDLVLEPSTFNSRSLIMGWTDRSGTEFGAHQLSDGTLRAIALITALLQPEESMPNIMLFDEPELGLHPAAIGLVSGLLKAASVKHQVIVATQSPLLIKDYKPEDLVVVERNEDERGQDSSTFRRLSAPALGSWLNRFNLGQLYEMNVTGGGAR